MKWFVTENNKLHQYIITDRGWGNGYVLLPKNHPFYGMHYNSISVDVHGGLTYSSEFYSDDLTNWNIKTEGITEEDIGKWCVGFDTSHYGDNLNRWPREKVEEKTILLFAQLVIPMVKRNKLERILEETK